MAMQNPVGLSFWLSLASCGTLGFLAGCTTDFIELEHAAGEGGAGAVARGGDDIATTAGRATTQTVGAAGASEPGDACETSCSEGFECFHATVPSTGRCVPLCDSQEKSAWGQSCENSLTGENGVCRLAFQAYKGGVIGVGICTEDCDPLRQDCPEHFKCAVTTDEAGSSPNRVFDCLPILVDEPYQTGAACNSVPSAECAAGLECILGATSDTFANCRAYCDATSGSACESGQTCTVPESFPPDTTVGVCLDD